MRDYTLLRDAKPKQKGQWWQGFAAYSPIQPDQSCHSSGTAVPAIGKEFFRIAKGAFASAVNLGDAGFRQSLSRQQKKIGEPFAVVSVVWQESDGGFPVMLDKCLAHFLANLKWGWAVGRPEPCHDPEVYPVRPAYLR